MHDFNSRKASCPVKRIVRTTIDKRDDALYLEDLRAALKKVGCLNIKQKFSKGDTNESSLDNFLDDLPYTKEYEINDELPISTIRMRCEQIRQILTDPYHQNFPLNESEAQLFYKKGATLRSSARDFIAVITADKFVLKSIILLHVFLIVAALATEIYR